VGISVGFFKRFIQNGGYIEHKKQKNVFASALEGVCRGLEHSINFTGRPTKMFIEMVSVIYITAIFITKNAIIFNTSSHCNTGSSSFNTLILITFTMQRRSQVILCIC
jgi:hypothetical protein